MELKGSTGIYLTDYEIVSVATILVYWKGDGHLSSLDSVIDKFKAAAEKIVRENS